MIEDLYSFHGFDTVQEIENALVEELKKSLDPIFAAEKKRKEREKKFKRIFKNN